MSSGNTAQDPAWKSKEQGDEARYAREKETAQLAAIRDRMRESEQGTTNTTTSTKTATTESEEKKPYFGRDFEGGFGGQEDLEDSELDEE
ncbi:hypothetical protein EIP91_005702 [Steccherinum ochraceum]|uniref:Uncharacterized protein n=1 Tax=Steccherinum ochraceum TaxID=92696 RepID=A0A4R0R6S7_9APHY|nr:hypothetical protein EIP91_005702 [Steccherinum ochraceum]